MRTIDPATLEGWDPYSDVAQGLFKIPRPNWDQIRRSAAGPDRE